MKQTFLINPYKAIKVRKGSTKAGVKHMEGGMGRFGNIQY